MGQHGAGSDDDQDRDFAHDDPVVDEALDWFARLREPDADASTRQRFQAWLSQDPRHQREFRALEEMWGSPLLAAALVEVPDAAHFRPPARRRSFPRGLALAASIAAAAIIWQYPSLMIAWQADYTTATGGQTTVTLPDGSAMTMNTASAVTVDFADGRRTVKLLRGEAYFDVEHDPQRPFVVTGGYSTVEVRGTAFSVRAEPDADEIVLERGRVDVTCLCETHEMAELSPDQAITATATALSTIRSTNTRAALAWREGRIAFEQARLGDVLAELRRYYGGSILVVDSRVDRLVVTGNYRLDDVEGAIRTLADAAGVGMTRIPGGLIILR